MRKTYIDNVRWITVVLVVIYHVIYMFNGVTTYGIIGPFCENQPQDIFQYVVYPWFMLLLFAVSGMSARFYLEQHSDREFIRSRTVKLLVPSTLGLLVGGWVMGYYNMLIGGAFEQMTAVPKPVLFLIMCVSGCGVLWYIQMLWLFCIILVAVRKIEKDRIYNKCKQAGVLILLVLTIFIYLSAQILNTPVIVVYRFGIYGAGFFIGYFILSHDEVADRMEKRWGFLSILACITGVIFVIRFWGKPYPEHEVLDTVLCNAYAWFGTLGVLAFMKKWGDFENHFTRWMNKNSWGLYVFHYLPIAMSAWYLRFFVPELSPAIVYLLTGLAGFSGGYLLNAVISRIPVIRWCILGLERK